MTANCLCTGRLTAWKPRRRSRRCLTCWGAIAAFLLASGSGCSSRSDDLPRVEFSGTVLRTGDSVDSGSVSVQPIDGHNGPAANGLIDDGEFTIPTAEGPTPGPHKVIIQFMPPKDELMRMQGAGQEPQTAWEFTVMIPEGRSYHHEFKLEAQALAAQPVPTDSADLTLPQ